MSIKNWFNKPKWQSQNEKVRMTAITNSQDPELIKNLLSIVETDTSQAVKKVAIIRMTDFQQLIKIANSNLDKQIRQLAHKKIIQWMSQDKDSSQLNIAKQLKDSTSIEALAKTAVSTEIRQSMIEQIDKQGLLGDLIKAETDHVIKQQLLDKISQASTLQRISKYFKKKDQKLFKQIINKLDAGNETVNYDKTGLELCQQLESVVHKKSSSKNIDLQKISQSWNNIIDHVNTTLIQRYAGAFSAAKMILDPEHRDAFLNKQKQQRIVTQISALAKVCEIAENSNLKQLQNHLNVYQNIDLQDATDSQKLQIENHLAKLLEIRDKKSEQQKIPTVLTDIFDGLNKELTKEIVLANKLKHYKDRWAKASGSAANSVGMNQLNTQFEQNILKLAEKIENSATLQTQAAQAAVDLIEQTKALIEDGKLAQAKITTNKIAKHKAKAGYNHPILKQNKFELDNLWNKLSELRQWQKWSNDKARADIINELSQLLGSGVHPDAVLKKLKDSNEKWYALEDMEKLEGDKYPVRNRDLWNKFRAVSKELFEPTQAFFEKRSEQQNLESDAVTSLIQKIQEYDLDSSTEKDLARISREAINHLKSLDKLPPKQRGKLAKKIRTGINRIDSKLKEFYAQAENNKLKLIEQAKSLVEENDLESAISQAKELQSQWKDAGIVKQYTERKLWKNFRKANDAVFKRREALKTQKNEEKQQQLKQADELLKKFETDLKSTKKADDIQSLLAQFNTHWHELHVYQKELLNRQNKATKKAHELIKNQKNRQILDFFSQLEQLDSICREFENNKIDQQQVLNKLSEYETKLEKNILTPYKDRISEDLEGDKNPDETMNNHLIKCEYLTGNETPKTYHQDRMAYQVKILSERLSGEKLPDERQQAMDLLNGWYLLAKPDRGFLKKNNKRINKNIKALMKLL